MVGYKAGSGVVKREQICENNTAVHFTHADFEHHTRFTIYCITLLYIYYLGELVQSDFTCETQIYGWI